MTTDGRIRIRIRIQLDTELWMRANYFDYFTITICCISIPQVIAQLLLLLLVTVLSSSRASFFGGKE